MSELQRYWVEKHHLVCDREASFDLYDAETVVTKADHDAALAALSLTWREEKPTEAGAYWWREDETGEPVMTVVDQMTSGLLGVNFPGSTEYHAVADWGGEWAGPLPTPREK